MCVWLHACISVFVHATFSEQKGHYILKLISSCFQVVVQTSGKVLEHFLSKVKIFVLCLCEHRGRSVLHFTAHQTLRIMTYSYPAIKALWVKEVSASQLLLIDMYLQTVRSLLLQHLWSHRHRYASSPTLTDHGVLCFFHESSVMLSLTDDTVDNVTR